MNDLDFERLSAYLDGALNEDERAALEARLAREPALRETLSELRSLKAWIGELPERKAPRDFTLTADMLGQDLRVTHSAVRYQRPPLAAAPQPKPSQRSGLVVTLAGLASSAAAVGLIVVGLALASSPAAPPAEIALVSTETPTARPIETQIIAVAPPQVQATEDEALFELFSAAPAEEPAIAPAIPLPTPPADLAGQIPGPLPEALSQMELAPQAARELAPELPVEVEGVIEAAEAILDDARETQATQPAGAAALPTETPTAAPPTPTEPPSPVAEPALPAAPIERQALGGLMFGAGAALLLVTAALWLRWQRRARRE